MKRATGNLWDYLDTHGIVIPTNIGWRNDGVNVMGRGVAKQASGKYPELALWYGSFCQAMASQHKVAYPVVYMSKLILFPTKPLDKAFPFRSWQGNASLTLIESGLKHMAQVNKTHWQFDAVALPLVGCGNGGLDRADVLPLLEQYLDDSFTLVETNDYS